MRVARSGPPSPAAREALLDLWVAAWAEAMPAIDFAARRAWFAARVDEHLAGGAVLLEARADGALAGYALVNPGTGYLDQVAVLPARKGQGVASALLEQAKRLSPEGLDLHVNRDNARALRLYERHGFAVVGEGVNPRSGLPIYAMRWRGAA